jgi:3-hydroxybutyryl-CoA dehydratase
MICSHYYDDLAEGDSFDTFGRTVSEFDIVAFGAITGDVNPQHVDRTFGEAGPFGERVAHGALVVSFALGLIPIDADRLIALRRLDDVKFKAPVQIGDTIHVEVRIERCRVAGDDSGLVLFRARVVNQRGELAARLDIEALWRREPGAEDAAGAVPRTVSVGSA